MRTLKEQLDAVRARFVKDAPPEALSVIKGAIEELRTSGIDERILKEGDEAPQFSLPNVQGTLVSSREMLDRGPLVLSFYRGKW